LSALDVKLREAMQVELKHLHQKLGITFLLVTHDQREALLLSDRVVVMERGRIVQAGTPTELYDRPATPYVADFIGTSNLIRAKVIGTAGGHVAVSAGPVTLRARANGLARAPGEEILLSIRPEKALLVDPATILPEDVNRIEGKAIETFFLGNAVRISVDVGQTIPFLVDMQLERAIDAVAVPKPGAAVAISIHPASVAVFAAPDAEWRRS
jgi:ABC-type Fe3+/spermidine/putrescine transport system ATPase subunit